MAPPNDLRTSRQARPGGAARVAPPGPGCRLVVDLTGDKARLRLRGTLDLTTVHDVRSELFRAVGADTDVVVDLSAVRQLDAAGLVLLLSASRRAAATGHRLALEGLSHDALELARATGLDRLLSIRRSAAV
ncbi:MAG: hypothetical protein JWM67_2473 [Mycobacterium sp.]|nr:hypothetical protein [Mycobacterium sp.]